MAYHFDGFLLDTERFELRGPNGPVAIEPQVFDVLLYLVAHRDRVVTKEELLDNIWGDRFVSESALTTRIKAARRAVDDDGQAQRVIRTSHGRGYRFVAKVSEVASGGVDSSVAPPVDVAIAERRPAGELLMTALRHALDGHGSLAVVHGEAGIGKTTLIHVVADSAVARHPELRVLEGACDDLLTAQPFAPLHDVARQLPDGALAAALAAGAERSSVFSALLDDLAAAPTLLLIDDLHWADDATLDAITFLGRRIAQLAALVVISYRDDEVDLGHPLRRVLATLRGPSARRVPLHPLTVDGVAELTGTTHEDAARIAEVSGGNPFFATEVAASTALDATASLHDVVLARVGRLPDDAQQAVRALSVVPGRVEQPIVDALVGPDWSVLAEPQRRAILAGDATAVWFRHELARRAIESSLAAVQRVSLHRRVVGALLASDGDAGRIVHHATASGDTLLLVTHALRAAREAARAGGHRESVAHYERVVPHAHLLETSERSEMHRQLAHELGLVGRLDEATTHANLAIDLARDVDRSEHAAALVTASRIATLHDDGTRSEALAREAVASVEAAGPSRALAASLAAVASALALDDRYDDAIPIARRAAQVASEVGADDLRALALIYLGMSVAPDDPESGVTHLQTAVALATPDHREELARAYWNLVVLLHSIGRAHETAPWIEQALTVVEEFSTRGGSYSLEAGLAALQFDRGDWDAAEVALRDLTARPDVPADLHYYPLALLARLLARRGDPEATTVLAAARAAAGDGGWWVVRAEIAMMALELAWLDGDIAPVRREVDGVLAHLHGTYLHHYRGQLLRYLARAGEQADEFPHCPEQYAFGIRGDVLAAAERWERIGNPYERALELAESGDPVHVATALSVLDDLGARGAIAAARRLAGTRGPQRRAGSP